MSVSVRRAIVEMCGSTFWILLARICDSGGFKGGGGAAAPALLVQNFFSISYILPHKRHCSNSSLFFTFALNDDEADIRCLPPPFFKFLDPPLLIEMKLVFCCVICMREANGHSSLARHAIWCISFADAYFSVWLQLRRTNSVAGGINISLLVHLVRPPPTSDRLRLGWSRTN